MRSALAIDVFDDESDRGGLPAWTYDNEELIELEKEFIFRRNWLIAGHVNEIPNPGDFMTFDVANERALIVRGQDGEVRAFHNVCRHRGSRVVAETRGNCSAVIQCPFHGWCYGLDGSLKGVPHTKSFPSMDKGGLGLKPVEFEVWHGLVFVRFKGEGASVAEIMAPLDSEIAPYRIADMVPLDIGHRVEFDVNWKAMVDVDNEGYHVPVAHPALNELYGRTYVDEMLENGVMRSFGIFDEGRNRRGWSVRHYLNLLPEATHLPENRRRAWFYYGIYPTTVVGLYPDMMEFYQFLPISARRSQMWGRSIALPDDRREMRAARYLNSRINETTTEEDIQLIKWSWEGMRSSAFDDVILSDIESGVRAFHDRLRGCLPILNEAEPPVAGTLSERNDELLAAR